MPSFAFILTLGLIPLTYAATVTYNFNIGWVYANPDAVFDRPVIGINGQWPLPPIMATVGDRVIVNVQNDLGNRTTSLHFHGLYMNGTNQMDGPVGVTQCPIAPGENFTYDFTVKQPGTYWYHSHVSAQYPDGLRGPLLIHDPDSPFQGQYDEERYLTLSDWYHDQMPDLMKKFINVANPKGAEPIPNAALMNDTQNLTSLVEPGKTYMFRIVNIGAFAGQYLWFEGHSMQIVEVDGIYTEPAETNMIYLTAAQRCSVLITAKNDTSTNYAFVGSMDTDLFDSVPDTLNTNVTGYLIYNNNPTDLPIPALLDSFDPFDDFTLIPKDNEPLLPPAATAVPLTVLMGNLGNGANYAFFNNITYVQPKVPTLYTALTTGDAANNPYIYGPNTNAFVLNKGDIIDIIVNNNDTGKHPFHLHGHAFQTIARGDDHSGNYVGNETFPAVPMRRDTFMLKPKGNIVLRFRADNPGIWLFHCHIEWHIASGLVATMVEAPTALQAPGALTLPPDHLAACAAQNIPTAGNAAGNTVDLLDMSGANTSVPPLPDGFTTRGIVALVFSVVAGLLGVAVIAWYGTGEIGEKEKRMVGADLAGVVTTVEDEGQGKTAD